MKATAAFVLASVLCTTGVLTGQGFRDDFNSSLQPGWTWVREDPASWNLLAGKLTIITQRGALNGTEFNNVANIIRRTAPTALPYRYTTKVMFAPLDSYHNAGLIYHVDDDNYIRISRGVYNDTSGVWLEIEKDGVPTVTLIPDVTADTTWLRLYALVGDNYTAQYSTNGTDWHLIARRQVAFSSGTRYIGLQAANGDGAGASGQRLSASFDYFEVEIGLDARETLPASRSFIIQSVFPQPAYEHESAVAEFALKAHARLRYEIVDLVGRVVVSRELGEYDSGEHRIEVSLSGLRSGLYMLRFLTPTETRTVPLSVR